MIEGDYFFDDDLQYEFDNWDYCTEEKDRRFYYERQTGKLDIYLVVLRVKRV